MYFWSWRKFDREGFAKWAGYQWQNQLFIRPGSTNKVQVWHANSELKQAVGQAEDALVADENMFSRMLKEYDAAWKSIWPYLKEEKKIDNVIDFKDYYKGVVRWWSTMAVLFFVPGMEKVSEEIKADVLALRSAGEKYSDKIDEIFVDYYRRAHPDQTDLAFVITPDEVLRLGQGKFSKSDLKDVAKRLEGYAFFERRSVFI